MDEGSAPKLEQRAQPHFFKKPDGGYVRPIFRLDGLQKLADMVPVLEAGSGRSYGLSLLILEYVFGYAWLERHVLDEPKQGFLARSLLAEGGHNIVMHRVRDLAEMVVNLLPVQGVEAPLVQIASGSLESGYAELETGKLLRIHGVKFRFIWPSGRPGEDFDLEVEFPKGGKVCADTKCKLETGKFTEKSLLNTLSGARKRNLPKGYPGAVFVKIPQAWQESEDIMIKAESACHRFLNDAKRLVCIFMYSSMFKIENGIIYDWLTGKTVRSHVHNFDRSLTDERLWTDGASLPDDWIRLSRIC